MPSSRRTTSAGVYPDEIDEDIARRVGNAFAVFTGAERLVVGRHAARRRSRCRPRSSRAPRWPAPPWSTPASPPPTSSTSPPAGLDAPGAMFTASHNPRSTTASSCAGPAPPRSARTPAWPRSRSGRRRGADVAAGRRARSRQRTWSTSSPTTCGRSSTSVLRPLKVVADTANGMGGLVVPRVFDGLPFDLRILFGELDGTFPNHPADPIQPENLEGPAARPRGRAPTSAWPSTATPTGCSWSTTRPAALRARSRPRSWPRASSSSTPVRPWSTT